MTGVVQNLCLCQNHARVCCLLFSLCTRKCVVFLNDLSPKNDLSLCSKHSSLTTLFVHVQMRPNTCDLIHSVKFQTPSAMESLFLQTLDSPQCSPPFECYLSNLLVAKETTTSREGGQPCAHAEGNLFCWINKTWNSQGDGRHSRENRGVLVRSPSPPFAYYRTLQTDISHLCMVETTIYCRLSKQSVMYLHALLWSQVKWKTCLFFSLQIYHTITLVEINRLHKHVKRLLMHRCSILYWREIVTLMSL